MKHSIILNDAQTGYLAFVELWKWCKAMLLTGRRLHLTAQAETRSIAQNSILWSILTDLSKQVPWHVDGQMQHLPPEDWKDILTAGLKRTQRVAAGIEGGFVMLGQRTSKMTVGEVSELVTFGHAFGDLRGVKWSRTSLGRDVPDEVFA